MDDLELFDLYERIEQQTGAWRRFCANRDAQIAGMGSLVGVVVLHARSCQKRFRAHVDKIVDGAEESELQTARIEILCRLKLARRPDGLRCSAVSAYRINAILLRQKERIAYSD